VRRRKAEKGRRVPEEESSREGSGAGEGGRDSIGE